MTQEQHLDPGTLPASRPDVLPRPKQFTELVAALDTHGFISYVRWTLWEDGSVEVNVTGVAPWDHIVRIEVGWTSPDGVAPLKRTHCHAAKPYHPLGAATLKAVHDLIAAKPEARSS